MLTRMPVVIQYIKQRSLAILDKKMHVSAWILAALFLGATILSDSYLDRIKYQYLAGNFSMSLGSLFREINSLEWIIVLAMILLGVWVLRLELKYQGVGKLLDEAPTGPVFVMLFSALVWFNHSLTGGGFFAVGDGGSHIARISHLNQFLKQWAIGSHGFSLFWDNYFFAGSTQLQFTGPIFHWIAAAASLVVGDPTLATKIILFCCRALALVFTYLLVMRLTDCRRAALFAGIFAMANFYVTYALSIRGMFPQAILMWVLPAGLYFCERILKQDKLSIFSLLMLVLCGVIMVGTHQPTAVVASIFLAAYIVWRLLWNPGRFLKGIKILCSFILAVVLSIYFWLPFIRERRWTAENFDLDMLRLQLPSIGDLGFLFSWGQGGLSDKFISYIGLSLLLPLVIVLVTWIRAQPWEKRVYQSQLRDIGFLIILTILSLVVKVNYVRPMLFSVFFLGLASALGIALIHNHFPHRHKRRWFVLFFLIVLIDLVPLAVQPWLRKDLIDQVEAGKRLQYLAMNKRVVEVQADDPGKAVISIGPDASPIQYALVQTLSGPHKPDAPPGYNVLASVLRLVEDDFNRNASMSLSSRALLSLWNVGWVVGHQKMRMGLPEYWAGSVPHSQFRHVYVLREATPVLISNRLTHASPVPGTYSLPFWREDFNRKSVRTSHAQKHIKKSLEKMQINWSRRQAGSILTTQTAPEVDPAWKDFIPSPRAPHISLSKYSVFGGRTDMTIHASGNGYLRIAHSASHFLKITLNEKRVKPVVDIFGQIVLPVRVGRNDIIIEAQPSSLRVYSFLFTALGSGLIVLMILILAVFRWNRAMEKREAHRM